MHRDLSHQSSLALTLTPFSLKTVCFITPCYLTSVLLVGVAFHGVKNRSILAVGCSFLSLWRIDSWHRLEGSGHVLLKYHGFGLHGSISWNEELRKKHQYCVFDDTQKLLKPSKISLHAEMCDSKGSFVQAMTKVSPCHITKHLIICSSICAFQHLITRSQWSVIISDLHQSICSYSYSSTSCLKKITPLCIKTRQSTWNPQEEFILQYKDLDI